MAEEIKSTGTEPTETNPTTNKEPSVGELMAQLEAAKADAERYKSANDKLSKSEAEMKRQLRAKLSEEEKLAEEKKEAQRLADEERETLKQELNRMKAISAYKDISEEKAVESLIDAVSNADHSAVAQIIANECKKAVANAEAEWLKDRPAVQHGQYSTMTKEQIMEIKDPAERQAKIAQNIELCRKVR